MADGRSKRSARPNRHAVARMTSVAERTISYERADQNQSSEPGSGDPADFDVRLFSTTPRYNPVTIASPGPTICTLLRPPRLQPSRPGSRVSRCDSVTGCQITLYTSIVKQGRLRPAICNDPGTLTAADRSRTLGLPRPHKDYWIDNLKL